MGSFVFFYKATLPLRSPQICLSQDTEITHTHSHRFLSPFCFQHAILPASAWQSFLLLHYEIQLLVTKMRFQNHDTSWEGNLDVLQSCPHSHAYLLFLTISNKLDMGLDPDSSTCYRENLFYLFSGS